MDDHPPEDLLIGSMISRMEDVMSYLMDCWLCSQVLSRGLIN